MHSFTTTFTVATACFAALTAAVPHARRHYQLHPVRNADLEPQVVKLAPLAGRQVPGTVNLSPIGQCGGSSGFGCGPGFCCSKWGYCGTTEAYCGAGGDNSTAGASAPAAGNPGYPQPSQWGPPAGSTAGPAPTSAATSAPSSAAGAPSGYAPGPSSAPAAAPSSAASPPASSAPAYSAPAPSASSGGSSGGGSFSGYKMYNGNGSPSAGWPSMSQWMSFDAAWTASLPNLMGSCAQWNVPNNSPQEASEIKAAILAAASTYSVDSRFILAIMMQESNGCVRVHTTNNGVVNPGLFQSHDGTGSCNNGQVLNPCPNSEIKQMVDDGVGGTAAGDGLKQTLASCSTTGAQAYYQAAVIYNSGNLPSNLDDNTATPCYASDVANRLMGWTQGASSCTL